MSLDSYLHDSTNVEELSEEDKKRFGDWMSNLLKDPSTISSMVEQSLRQGMFSEWEEESINHQFRVGSYYPSIVEKCVRQQAYSYLSPMRPTAEELAIFGEGKAVHELIALTLRRSGLISVEGREVVVDLKFNDEAKLHGRIDDLLLIRVADNESGEFKLFIPLEIKTTSTLPDEPKRAHYYQLSTYLLAKNFELGGLLYWAKREGKTKAFAVKKESGMYAILRDRVLELHNALKAGVLPKKEAALQRDFKQCERCAYIERCNPFLVDTIPKGAKVAVFDIDSVILDATPRRKAIFQELGLGVSRVSDISDEETRGKFWQMYEDPKFIAMDDLLEQGKTSVYDQIELQRSTIGISASRHEGALEATKAKLANNGVPIQYLIVREDSNFETETKFKTKWLLRLAQNYKVCEYFDRNAVTTSVIMKAIEDLNKITNDSL